MTDATPGPNPARDAADSAWTAWRSHVRTCQRSCLYGTDCPEAGPLKTRLLQARTAALAPSSPPATQQ